MMGHPVPSWPGLTPIFLIEWGRVLGNAVDCRITDFYVGILPLLLVLLLQYRIGCSGLDLFWVLGFLSLYFWDNLVWFLVFVITLFRLDTC